MSFFFLAPIARGPPDKQNSQSIFFAVIFHSEETRTLFQHPDASMAMRWMCRAQRRRRRGRCAASRCHRTVRCVALPSSVWRATMPRCTHRTVHERGRKTGRQCGVAVTGACCMTCCPLLCGSSAQKLRTLHGLYARTDPASVAAKAADRRIPGAHATNTNGHDRLCSEPHPLV